MNKCYCFKEYKVDTAFDIIFFSGYWFEYSIVKSF